jgi:hypothetical protein
MIRRTAAVLAVFGAALCAAIGVKAASPAVCPTITVSGVKLLSETIGHSWTCSAAKVWIVKFASEKVGPSDRDIPLKNGPRGYHCIATPRKQSHAVDGTCFTGTKVFPGTGFAWLSK